MVMEEYITILLKERAMMPLKKGEKNCITDVADVRVGHVTLYEKRNDTDTICTGVTAILPHGGNLFQEKVRAASYVVNGFGKTNGLIQVDELGTIESPIMLTNTFSVGAVMQGTLTYMLNQDETIGDSTSSLNLVVGECNDSYLNSMRLQAVQPKHAIEAITSATTDAAEEGAVGAGKGMVCYQYKGGIGTSSRLVLTGEETYTFGVLVLSNFGEKDQALFADWNPVTIDTPDGSIMMIVATDAPLYDRQLKRIAKRTAIGLGRTGSMIGHGSGDIAIAFSTANKYTHQSETETEVLTHIRDDDPVLNKMFQAVIEATEEAIINSLRSAETTYGRKGRVIEKAPLT